MHESNIAMLAKQAWRLVQQPSTLVSRLFKARYYPSSSFMLACKGSSPSYIWTSILAAKEFLCQSLVWRIGDGATVRVWEDSWLPILGAPRILSPVVEGLEDMKVHQLFSPSPVKTWNFNMLNSIFMSRDVQAIIRIPLSIRSIEDHLGWQFSPSGVYSVNSGYKDAMNLIPPVISRASSVWSFV